MNALRDAAPVFDLDRRRIQQALEQRARYKYVAPRIEREGDGWKIVSPNCSRTVDPSGGEIDIAWFEPQADGRWRLHARDHGQAAWVVRAEDLTLLQALALVCDDTDRIYWP